MPIIQHKGKRESAFSVIVSAIEREAVAAGEGAFNTLITLSDS